MSNRILLYIFLVFFVALNACAPPKSISTQKADGYEEALAEYRIQYEDSLQNNDATVAAPERNTISGPITTRYAVTEEVDNYLDAVSENNREKNEYQGFTLQVYTGGSREEANEAKAKVYDALPDARPNINYNSSIYRVKVGEYASRLEAQEDYNALKEDFPYVLLVPQKFKVVN